MWPFPWEPTATSSRDFQPQCKEKLEWQRKRQAFNFTPVSMASTQMGPVKISYLGSPWKYWRILCHYPWHFFFSQWIHTNSSPGVCKETLPTKPSPQPDILFWYGWCQESTFTRFKVCLLIHLLSLHRLSHCSPGWPGIPSAAAKLDWTHAVFLYGPLLSWEYSHEPIRPLVFTF